MIYLKRTLLKPVILAMLGLNLLTAYANPKKVKDPVDYVNPYIGTISPKTHGLTPAVLAPGGAVRTFPSFTPSVRDQYLADKIYGFPLGFANLMASSGEIRTTAQDMASRFDHDLETVRPYYYQVLLEDPDINVEFTLTQHVFLFRFTFPENASSNLTLALTGNATMTVKDEYVLQGYASPGNHKSYFYAQLNKPAAAKGFWNKGELYADAQTQNGDEIGWYAKYATTRTEKVEIRIALSAASSAEAQGYLATETGNLSFDQVKTKTRELWNRELNLIKIEGGTEKQRTIFYSALYLTRVGMGNVWDTYRCAYPLQTIIKPQENLQAIRGFIKAYEETGWLPSSGAMIGHHSTAVIVDSYMKGLCDFDVEKAYQGMKKNAMQATMIPWKDQGYITELEQCYFDKGFYPALPVREEARVADPVQWRANGVAITKSTMPFQIGWFPEVGVKEWVTEVNPWHRRQSVSVTLEHCYDDWCLAQLAQALGKEEDYRYFMKRAFNYRNLYNPGLGFMAPKSADGEWLEPFDPKLSGGFAGEAYFAEANSWIYTWHVQHDVQGLINLMGGREKFIDKLNALFVEQYVTDKPAFIGQFPDMTGLIGMYGHGNEPAFHIPYLYNYAGQPWMTQRTVRMIMDLCYDTTPSGYCGDDDGGAMSSWYVLTAMWFYPQCPGRPIYDIGSPLFSKAIIDVGRGRTFVIKARNVSTQNKYIQSVVLNGQPWEKPWFYHADIVKGGSMVMHMGPRPNKKWGSAPDAAAPSMSKSGGE